MAAGYKERDIVSEADDCGGLDVAEVIGCSCTEALCQGLSLDCFGHCSLSGARPTPTSGVAFDYGSLVVFFDPDLKHSPNLSIPIQLHCCAII